MSLHIIIDGYNLIRQSPVLSELDQQDMQLARETLISHLAAYKKVRGHRITVVFDGQNAPQFSQQNDRSKGIDVKFSFQGELADTVIKKMSSRERERALIVSSDKDIVGFARRQGSATISSPEFEDKIALSQFIDSQIFNDTSDDYTGWKPTTKKKGPKRRLSKRERKSRVKIDKL